MQKNKNDSERLFEICCEDARMGKESYEDLKDTLTTGGRDVFISLASLSGRPKYIDNDTP